MQSFAQTLMSKKKNWTPTIGTPSPVAEGSEETIGKALALRSLEIPVGDWIYTTNKRESNRLTDDQLALLDSNIEDEYKHDEALNLAANAYKLTTPEMEKEAKIITDEWLEHGDHPLVKAWVIENSVFFVILPIFRMLGGAGLRLVSTDISNDESIHVATNRYLSKELGYTYSPSLDALRRKTVAWVVDSLDAPGKYGLGDFWLKSSDDLLLSGKAPQLADSKAYVMPAFFEHHNQNLPVYY